jgi:hypothetical protein
MAGRFDIQFPARNYLGMDGGKNNKTSKQWILDNESPDCLNVIFGMGSVETRPGSQLLNTAPVATFAVDGLYTRHDNDGSETMTVWCGGTMYYLSGTTFNAIASSVSAWTAGVRVCAAEYENNLFMDNGFQIAYKWNGTDLTRHGVYPPTTTMTANSHASGTCLATATLQYAVTYVNSALVEGNLGPATTFAVSGGTGCQLTSVPVAPQSFGVNYRYIYRSVDSGANYYRVGSILNNTATTFVDGTVSAAATVLAPIDNGLPPKYKAIVTHNSRLFMIGDDNFVWYSNVGNPYVVDSTNFRRIGDATGEIPTALGVWDNFLAVFCKSGQTWLVYMPSNDDSEWIDVKLRSNYGSKSPYAIFSAMNQLIFPATEANKFVGFAAMTAAGLDPQASLTEVGAVGSDMMTENIQPDIEDFNQTYVGNMSAIVFKSKAYIAYTDENVAYNNRIYVLDFSNLHANKKQKYTWAPWSGLNIAQFCVYEGNLYGALSTATGQVYKLLTSNYDDNSVAINSYYWTKEFYGNPGHETWWKDWRFANIIYELCGAWKMGLTTRVDSDSGSGTEVDVDLTPSTTLWGSTLVWSSTTWDAGRSEFDLKRTLGNFRGKRIQFKFSNKNTAGRKFRIVGMKLRYNLKGIR